MPNYALEVPDTLDTSLLLTWTHRIAHCVFFGGSEEAVRQPKGPAKISHELAALR